MANAAKPNTSEFPYIVAGVKPLSANTDLTHYHVQEVKQPHPKLQGCSMEPIAVGYDGSRFVIKYIAGAKEKAHLHSVPKEIMVLDGKFIMKNPATKTTATLTKGSYLHIPAFVPYEFECESEGQILAMYAGFPDSQPWTDDRGMCTTCKESKVGRMCF